MAGSKLDNLKLGVAKPVDDIPQITKGSAINNLQEFKDATTIIMAVKESGDASGRKWEIFDKEQVIKESPELRKLKKLVVMFASKVRTMIEKQGLGKKIRLEQRKDKFYLVGVESKRFLIKEQ